MSNVVHFPRRAPAESTDEPCSCLACREGLLVLACNCGSDQFIVAYDGTKAALRCPGCGQDMTGALSV